MTKNENYNNYKARLDSDRKVKNNLKEKSRKYLKNQT